jgi:hypothetical protein
MVSCEELELGGVRDVAELVNTPHHARTDARRRTAVAVSAFAVSRKVAVFLRSGVMTSVSLARRRERAESERNPRSSVRAIFLSTAQKLPPRRETSRGRRHVRRVHT